MVNRVAPYLDLADGEPCRCPGCRFRREMDAQADRPSWLGAALLALSAVGALALIRLAVR